MANEDIVTALKNAVNNGEALDSAIQIMINSGYDSKEVQEASQFIGAGVISNLQQNQIPQQLLNKIQSYQSPQQTVQQYKSLQQQQIQQQVQQPLNQQLAQQPSNQILQNSSQQPKKSYFKEIMLVIILIILLGVLGATIFFRDKILGFFS